MSNRTAYVMSENQTTIATACDAFLIDRKARGYTRKTIQSYEERLGAASKWFEAHGVTDLEQIKAMHLRSYIAELQDQGLAAWTVHGQARTLKTFLRWCVADGWLEVNPMLNVRMPKLPKTIKESISQEDVRKLLDATENSRDNALILFLLDTGVRCAECANLKVGDIDLKTSTVLVRLGKGQKDRTVYLGAKSTKALMRYWRDRCKGTPGPQEAVWCVLGSNSKGLTSDGIREALERLGRKSGVKGASPHAFRRTFALWSLRAGMSIYHLQRIMGHADLQMLLKYLDLAESDLADAHAKHGAVDGQLR